MNNLQKEKVAGTFSSWRSVQNLVWLHEVFLCASFPLPDGYWQNRQDTV